MENSPGFESTAPETVGITSASVLNLLDTLRMREINIHSLMVVRHGKAAVELWWQPYSPEQPHQLYSFSKSIASAAVGIAIGEGRLSLEDRIAGFFPRRIDADADERIYSVTVEHLLTMTSGAAAQNELAMRRHTDWAEWFLNTPLNSHPGERFVYNSINTYMLAVILRKVTGEGLVDYLMPRLFEPLGIERPVWDTCPMGIECGGWGLYLRTADMAKFCQLCLDGGVWRGRRLLPEGWAELAGSCHVQTVTDSKLNDSHHRTAGYGYQFWRNSDGTSWRADGMFGQFGIIMPQTDTVIAITAGHASQMEIMDILCDLFLPHIGDIPEGSSPGADYDELRGIAGELRCPMPVPKPRNLRLEEQLEGKSFDFSLNSHSLLPLSVRYLHRIKGLGVTGIRFEFGGGQPKMCWTEDGTEHCIPFAMDGGFCSSTLTCAHRSYPIVAAAAWTKPDTLEVDIRLIHTAHMNRIQMRFEEDSIYCTFDEDPSLERMLKMLFDMARPVRPVANRIAGLVGRMIPAIKGTARHDVTDNVR